MADIRIPAHVLARFFMIISACGPGAPVPGDSATSGASTGAGPSSAGDEAGPGETTVPTSEPSTTLTTSGGSTSEPPTTQTATSGASDPIGTGTAVDPGSSSTGSTGDVPCEEIDSIITPTPPNVVLVLDKSGSMVVNPHGFWDHDSNPITAMITRWNSLHQVVQDLTFSHGDRVNFGAALFPSKSATAQYDGSACVVSAEVEAPVAAMNSSDLLDAIPPAGDANLKGATPTAAGVTIALNHLKGLDPAVSRAIVLITDGAANCAMGSEPPPMFETYDQSLHTIVQQAHEVDQIPTYVVGIAIKDVVSGDEKDGDPDKINNFNKLNELAVQGGRPREDPEQRFYLALDQPQLKQALLEVVDDTLSCSLPLPFAPKLPEMTGVAVGNESFSQVEDCASDDGWVYDDPDGPFTAIILCGAACEALKAAGSAEVEFFCGAI